MKKLLFVLMAVIMMAVPLAGCASTPAATEAPVATAVVTEAPVAATTAPAAAEKFKIGILAPAVTHGWVAAVAYNARTTLHRISR